MNGSARRGTAAQKNDGRGDRVMRLQKQEGSVARAGGAHGLPRRVQGGRAQRPLPALSGQARLMAQPARENVRVLDLAQRVLQPLEGQDVDRRAADVADHLLYVAEPPDRDARLS